MKRITIAMMLSLMAVGMAAQQTSEKGGWQPHPFLDLNASLGYAAGSNGGGFLMTDIEVGRRTSKNFFLGLSSGLWYPSKGKKDARIPVMAVGRLMFPSASNSITPFVTVKGGYVIATKKNDGIDPSFIGIQVMPGIQLPMSRGCDVDFSVGWMGAVPTGDGNMTNHLAVKIGVSLHHAPGFVLQPSKKHAFQLTVEGGTSFGFLGVRTMEDNICTNNEFGIAATYKLSRKLMAGIGASHSSISNDWEDDYKVKGHVTKVFARGLYRTSDRFVSPILGLDLGLRSVDEDNRDEFSEMYVSPSVGLSFRATTTSYIDLRIGADLFQKREIDEYDASGIHKEETAEPYFRIAFTKTF